MTQQILFCADRYMQNVGLVEGLIKESFPEPRYRIISLSVDPDHVAQQVDQWIREQKISSSNPPALFFFWNCLNERSDVASIWQPLFEKCKAVALVHFLDPSADKELISAYWRNAWKYESIPHYIVNIDVHQKSLSNMQRAHLEAVCNVEAKKSTNKTRDYLPAMLALGVLALLGLLVGLLYRRQFHPSISNIE